MIQAYRPSLVPEMISAEIKLYGRGFNEDLTDWSILIVAVKLVSLI